MIPAIFLDLAQALVPILDAQFDHLTAVTLHFKTDYNMSTLVSKVLQRSAPNQPVMCLVVNCAMPTAQAASVQ